MKVHPVTGTEDPDEDAQIEVYRFVNPKATKWAKADFIIGNPPFHGARTVRANNVHVYIEAVRAANSDVHENARPEERRVGNECASPCSSRWSQAHHQKNTTQSTHST